MRNRRKPSAPDLGQTHSHTPAREMSLEETQSWLESLRARLAAKKQRERAYLDRRAARGIHTLTDDTYEQDQRLEEELLALIDDLLQVRAEMESEEP